MTKCFPMTNAVYRSYHWVVLREKLTYMKSNVILPTGRQYKVTHILLLTFCCHVVLTIHIVLLCHLFWYKCKEIIIFRIISINAEIQHTHCDIISIRTSASLCLCLPSVSCIKSFLDPKSGHFAHNNSPTLHFEELWILISFCLRPHGARPESTTISHKSPEERHTFSTSGPCYPTHKSLLTKVMN